MRKLRVAVLMGGVSSERGVSLVSGQEVVKNLDREKFEVEGVVVPEELDKLDRGWDVVFIAMHGKGGEDGVIQGYLETKRIRYTGSGVAASAIGMDKALFRKVMESVGVPMAKLTNKVPCVVKPAAGGSSVGVSIVKDESDLEMAIKKAREDGDKVIIEEYLKGREVSCGVLGNKLVVPLPIVEIRPKKDFFDYEAKYGVGMSEEICPALIEEGLGEEIQKLSVKAFKAIGGRGFARVDFIICKDKPYCLEINTIPGLTPNSLLPKEAKAAGMAFPQLLEKMIDLALE